MNDTQDWDTIWRWHWFRRALWQPYFRDPSHPEGRPARSAPIWRWLLQQYGAQRVLDASCGLGMRAILLEADGFDVVGADTSAAAVQHAGELAASLGARVAFECCGLGELGSRFPAEFDAVINDGFAWTMTRGDLRRAAESLSRVLCPGGALIFTGADQWSNADDRHEHADHAWHAAPRFQLRADHERDGTHMTLVVARDKVDLGVVENYLFVVREGAAARLETASICNTMQWTWDDFRAVCREAGFRSVESVKVPVGRREHVLNVARK